MLIPKQSFLIGGVGCLFQNRVSLLVVSDAYSKLPKSNIPEFFILSHFLNKSTMCHIHLWFYSTDWFFYSHFTRSLFGWREKEGTEKEKKIKFFKNFLSPPLVFFPRTFCSICDFELPGLIGVRVQVKATMILEALVRAVAEESLRAVLDTKERAVKYQAGNKGSLLSSYAADHHPLSGNGGDYTLNERSIPNSAGLFSNSGAKCQQLG